MKGHRYVSSLFGSLIIFVFATVSVLLISVGAQVYGEVGEALEVNAALRTAGGYLTNKQRELGTRFEAAEDMLICQMTLDGQAYICRIYLYEGVLTESLLPIEYEFERGIGEPIVKLDRFEVSEHAGYVEVRAVRKGSEITKRLWEDDHVENG